MNDRWLEHGHETSASDLTPVFSSSSVLAEGAGAPAPPSWTSGWRALVIGGGLALLATLGVVGVANAIGDNLFPSMGSTSPASVWQNPVPPTEPTPTTVAVPSTATTAPSTTTPTTTPSTTPTTAPSSVPTTAPTSRTAGSPSSSVATVVSPTTSMLDEIDDGPDDDLRDDSSGSGSDDSSRGSGSHDSSGSSGSDDSSDTSGSDDSDSDVDDIDD